MWLNRAFDATDGPAYVSLQAIASSDFESTDCRLFEALLEKILTVPLLQDIIDATTELQTNRRELGYGLSVLYLLRVVFDKISPMGAEAGQRSRSMRIINKLEITGVPLLDLEHFPVRVARAKQIYRAGRHCDR